MPRRAFPGAGSRATGNRAWAVTLTLTCDTCRVTATATVEDITKVGAVEGVERDLRYKGWHLGRIVTKCPDHRPQPMPVCVCCGRPTPSEYGQDMVPTWAFGAGFKCNECIVALVQRSAQTERTEEGGRA